MHSKEIAPQYTQVQQDPGVLAYYRYNTHIKPFPRSRVQSANLGTVPRYVVPIAYKYLFFFKSSNIPERGSVMELFTRVSRPVLS